VNFNTSTSTPSPADNQHKSSESTVDPVSQNIKSILAFYADEEQKISRSQRVLENISGFARRPIYIGSILLFVALWILANVLLQQSGLNAFDSAPFSWLQGIVGLGGLLTATVVLIKQDRLATLEERRAHLDLQVNLLTEQKVTKLIDLIEELRRDLPMVKNRDDPNAAAFQQPTDPHQVLAALDEGLKAERLARAGAAKEDNGKA
jgi:uncharacterized membrane protein